MRCSGAEQGKLEDPLDAFPFSNEAGGRDASESQNISGTVSQRGDTPGKDAGWSNYNRPPGSDRVDVAKTPPGGQSTNSSPGGEEAGGARAMNTLQDHHNRNNSSNNNLTFKLIIGRLTKDWEGIAEALN